MKHKSVTLIVIFTLLLAAYPLQAQAQGDGPLYVVQSGDALSRIAEAFGTTVNAIMAENGITNPDLLVPGTTLVIPGFHGLSGYLTMGGGIPYGQNLESLSLLHGLSQEWLVRLNRWLNPERIYVGQPLILPQDGEEAVELPTSRTFLPEAGESLLEIALLEDLNPWSVVRNSGQAPRMWVVPGNPLRIADAEQPTDALPDPFRSIGVDPDVLVQGHTARVTLEIREPSLAGGQLGEWSLSFHELEPLSMVALQGVSAVAEPGVYDLEVSLRAEADGPVLYAYRQPVPLVQGNYGFDPVLDVPGVTVNQATIQAEQELWESVVNQVTEERYWQGTFSYPATRTTVFPSVFGSRRNYNQLGYYNYHTGLDFYSLMGEAIPAAARGRVVFAQSMTIRGNTTVIDHGWGIFTAYMHQSQIRVEVGDFVEAGQMIGQVGNTGRVAGPHLHWEVLVGGVPVDPVEWVENEFP
jgi:murein DD-endopeptidase MepM/ murein hydrolase activator NlpD